MKFLRYVVIVLAAIFIAKPSYAYDEKIVHRAINAEAVENSSRFKASLQQLEINLDSKIYGTKIVDWFRKGGTAEDVAPRWLNHFHDPTISWEVAGLKGEHVSSVLWVQQEFQDLFNTWSWPQARRYYLEGLTAPSRDDREKNLARSFRSLGQNLHLLADSAVPAHVRNDLHPLGDPYELYCKNNIKKINIASPSIGTGIVNRSLVPDLTPITNFWDTTPIPGANPNPEGLAEYTNHNFLSKDTIFSGYPYPTKADSDALPLWLDQVTAKDGQIDNRVYLSGKTNDNKAIDHLASTGYFWSELQKTAPDDVNDGRFNLDDECFKDYASNLIPKAVAYGAGLLDYFFRGKLDGIPASGGLRVKNSGSEEMTYYADPGGHQIGQISIYYDDIDKIRHPLTTYELLVPLAPGETTPVIHFSPPSYPPNIEPGRYIVVFQGKLGQEEGAVIGKVTSPQRLYYVSVRSGIYKIYSMKTDGSEPTVIYDNLNSALKIGKLALSPDGKTLAFTVNGPKIYLLNIATGGLIFLTNGGWPAWSPDGMKIAFSREMGRFYPYADEHIFTRDVATGGETQLTNSTASAYNSTPAWSPDGGKIAYMTMAFAPEANCVNVYAISLMGAAGNHMGSLTCDETNYMDETPAWSSDGMEIAFSRRREGKFSQLHKVNVATHEVTKLTDSTGDDYAEFTPSWFPERGKIAVGSNIDGDFDIWLVDSNEGGYIENLTDSNPDIDGYPVFEP